MKRPMIEARNGISGRAMVATPTEVPMAVAVGRLAPAAGPEAVKIGYIRWMERISMISLPDKPARQDG